MCRQPTYYRISSPTSTLELNMSKSKNGNWTDPLETPNGMLYGAAAMNKRIALQKGMVPILETNARQAGEAAARTVIQEFYNSISQTFTPTSVATPRKTTRPS